MMSLPIALAQDRQRKGFNQQQLATATGIPYQTLVKWERGLTLPRDKRLNQLIEFFGEQSDTARVSHQIQSVREKSRMNGKGLNPELSKIKKIAFTQQTTHVAPKKPSTEPENGSKSVIKGMVMHPTEFYVSEGYVVIAQPDLDGYIFLTAAQAEEFIVWASNPEKLQVARRFEKLNSMAFYKEN